jgi:Ca2+-binding RTX toxin-like protein
VNSKRVLLTALTLAAATPLVALGADNTLPTSNTGRSQTTITANTLKPAACAALTLAVVTTSVSGSNSAELLLATANPDTITARNGTDCVLGGAGDDTINCGSGNDVAIGGPGTDTFANNCETQIQ